MLSCLFQQKRVIALFATSLTATITFLGRRKLKFPAPSSLAWDVQQWGMQEPWARKEAGKRVSNWFRHSCRSIEGVVFQSLFSGINFVLFWFFNPMIFPYSGAYFWQLGMPCNFLRWPFRSHTNVHTMCQYSSLSQTWLAPWFPEWLGFLHMHRKSLPVR